MLGTFHANSGRNPHDIIMSMNKRLKIIAIILIALVLGAAATYGSIIVVSSYLDQQYTSLHDGCPPRQSNHVITIQNNIASPEHVAALRCETLTVKNLDTPTRLMAFGVHEKHISYDGISEQELGQSESFTVTLVQTGDFIIHDHHNDDVKSTFTVQ